MNQPSLFDSLEMPVEPAPVRQEPIRKYLNHKLWTLRRADHMPWSKTMHKYEENDFRRFVKVLPDDEADAMVAEFEALTAKLRYSP
jgi:hypothetical protein